MARFIAILLTILIWPALGYQLGNIVFSLLADGESIGFAVGRYFAYYTILTNLAVAAVVTALAMGSDNWLTGATTRYGVAVSIIMVGLIYSYALRHLNPTEGWGRAADQIVHDIVPIGFALIWLLKREGETAWSDIKWAVLGPVLYTAYILIRGAIFGWYPYWFLDLGEMGLVGTAISISVLVSVFVAAGLVLIWIDRFLAQRLAGPNSAF
jgi:hypothetical protein